MTPSLTFATVRRIGLTALLLGMAATHAAAAARTVAPPTTVSDAATGFLSRWPEFTGASVQAFVPIYKPRTNTIVYYEAKLLNGRTGLPNGSLILNLAGKVVQFTTRGKSFADQLAAKTNADFKLVRFGPRYMAAEDARGTRVAEVGELPRVPVSATEPRLLERPSVRFNSLRMNPSRRPQFDRRAVREYASPSEMYADYVLNYDAYFAERVKPAAPPDFFGGVMGLIDLDPEEDGGSGGSGSGSNNTTPTAALAIGHDKAIRFPQLGPTDPLNTLGYWSGCGGAAWMNILNWHDANGWAPGVMTAPYAKSYYESPNRPTSPWEAVHLIGLNQALGTFENIFNDLGATFASDMHLGHDVYARLKLGYNVDLLEVDSWLTNEPEAIAIKGISHYGKPVIIGYWDDFHYDVAYRWKRDFGTNYFLTDFSPTTDQPTTWVTGDDIFYAAFPMDVRSVGNNFGENASFETGLEGWKWKLTGGSTAMHMRRQTNAARGLAFMRLPSSTSGTQKAWATLKVPSAGVTGHTVSIKLNGTPGVTAIVKLRAANGDPAAEPQGEVKQSKTISIYGFGWQTVEFDMIPVTGSFTLDISYTNSMNSYMHLDVDDGIVTTKWHDQQPATWQGLPCVKGKPGLDEGCDFP